MAGRRPNSSCKAGRAKRLTGRQSRPSEREPQEIDPARGSVASRIWRYFVHYSGSCALALSSFVPPIGNLRASSQLTPDDNVAMPRAQFDLPDVATRPVNLLGDQNRGRLALALSAFGCIGSDGCGESSVGDRNRAAALRASALLSDSVPSRLHGGREPDNRDRIFSSPTHTPPIGNPLDR